MTWETFVDGFSFLCAVHGKPVDDEQAKAYFRVLSPHFTDAAWSLSVREVAEAERFWPLPVAFLSRLRAGDEAEERAYAGRLFVAIERASSYSPAGGAYYRRDVIEGEFGELAVQAFDAAGGSAAFKDGDPTNTAFTRKAFIEAYLDLSRAAESRDAAASQRQLEREEPKQLPSAEESFPGFRLAQSTPEEKTAAKAILDRIREPGARELHSPDGRRLR